jgi:hypothetical protein
VRVQVVHHQRDPARLGIMHVHQFLHLLREVQLRPPAGLSS